MNIIQFGIKTRQLSNLIKSQIEADFIIKDTNGYTTIIKSIFNQYYKTLDTSLL
jgi:hypothetical protein